MTEFSEAERGMVVARVWGEGGERRNVGQDLHIFSYNTISYGYLTRYGAYS
jgi:hypothetical protein